MARLEHANITVADAAKTAAWLGRVLGWTIRWEGEALNNAGFSIHVGSKNDYLALYQPNNLQMGERSDHCTGGQMNHIGIVVDDLRVTESAVLTEGFETHSHQDYEPGERFYFSDENHIEFEIVAYD